jgi:hypothetical protein
LKLVDADGRLQRGVDPKCGNVRDQGGTNDGMRDKVEIKPGQAEFDLGGINFDHSPEVRFMTKTERTLVG